MACATYTTAYNANKLAWLHEGEGASSSHIAIASYSRCPFNVIELLEAVPDATTAKFRTRAILPTTAPAASLRWSPHGAQANGFPLLLAITEAPRLYRVTDVTEEEGKSYCDGIWRAGYYRPLLPNPDYQDDMTAFAEKHKDTTRCDQILDKVNTFPYNDRRERYMTSVYPFVACEWNPFSEKQVVCLSTDGVAHLWETETNAIGPQILCHEGAGYDMKMRDANTFVTCGADGTVRLFDMRDLTTCQIVYHNKPATASGGYASTSKGAAVDPIVRLSVNTAENSLALIGPEDTIVRQVDLRAADNFVSHDLVGGHSEPINSISHGNGPTSVLCSAGQDRCVNIWQFAERYLTYDAPYPVNDVQWSMENHSIMITTTNGVELLHI